MGKFRITGVRLRKRVRTTVPEPSQTPVPDLFKRDFTAGPPNLKYMGDVTYLPAGDGEHLYLATVLDCFSHRIVGWPIADHMHTGLVTEPLTMAASTRGSLSGATCHNEHGAQYGSRQSAALCAKSGVTQSRGAVGHQRGQRRLRILPRLPENARHSKAPAASADPAPAGAPCSDG
ncbi:DDE-type integrase/transposase/recombinase [Streptomyces osmaniensis]|uniref:Integrase catalytic domain-containing protein n=1 Tax=Streptomyces osmaniensis TaxID=593134 RepID=A0ABP6Z4G2_9ACTN|nr:DDE-type integrase/transposase/recombinase [Streptomyces sp. JCM17656]